MKNYSKSSEFKALYNSILGYRGIDSSFFSSDDFLNLITSSVTDIDNYQNIFNNKNIQADLNNDELLNNFNDVAAKIKLDASEEISKVIQDKNDEIKSLEKNDEKTVEEIISEYKKYEDKYIPLIKNLQVNKSLNKEKYLKDVRTVNQERIEHNSYYENDTNDILRKNEQLLFDLQHQKEHFDETFEYDRMTLKNHNIDELNSINEKSEEDKALLQKEIKAQEKLISDQTVALNEEITRLEKEFDISRKHAYIPYDLEDKQFKTKLNNELKLYKHTEGSILQEFKNNLQEVDNLLSSIRDEQKEAEIRFNEKVEEIKNKNQKLINKQILQINRKIVNAKQQMEKTNDKKLLKYIAQQEREKIQIKKQINSSSNEEILALKKVHLAEEFGFIKQLEEARTKRLFYEGMKSNAMKNLNAEKDVQTNIFNKRISLVAFDKDTYTSVDQCNEARKVLDLRISRDINTADIQYSINEIERQIKENEFYLKQAISVSNLEYLHELKVIDINQKYQNSIIENRVNYTNVANMLEAQKNQIIMENEATKEKEKMSFLSKNNSFYNECDAIQYKLYTIEHDQINQKLDAKRDHISKNSENIKQYIEFLKNSEKNSINNEATYKENIARCELYKNRFEVEKKMLTDSYELFYKSISRIISIENALLTSICSFIATDFINHKDDIIESLESIRALKLSILNDYLDQEIAVINARINFEKGVKYNKILDSMQQEISAYLEQAEARKNKLQQTIQNYKSTIELFNSNIQELEQKNIDIKKESQKRNKKLTSSEKANIKLQAARDIQVNLDHIKQNEMQIKTNEKNILDLNKLLDDINESVQKKKDAYQLQVNNILIIQTSEAKRFYDAISLIKKQYNILNNKISKSTQSLTGDKFSFEKRITNCNQIISINNKFREDARNFFDNHYNYLINAVNKEISSLEGNYFETYIASKNQITMIKDEETRSHELRLKTNLDTYSSTVNAITNNYETEKNNLLQHLDSIMKANLNDYKKSKEQLALYDTILKRKLLVHEDNFKEYEDAYNATNKAISDTYHKELKDANKELALAKLEIENENKNFLKLSQQRNRTNLDLKKNTILDSNIEYKENCEHYKKRQMELHQKEKENAADVDASIELILKNFTKSQAAGRKEYEIQYLKLQDSCNAKILEAQKDFKKKFMKN